MRHPSRLSAGNDRPGGTGRSSRAKRVVMNTLDHERYMRRAIALARRVPDLPFGAVIVDGRDGRVLAEGWNRTHAHPLWHGEIDALNRLVRKGAHHGGRHLVLYTTAEPCPMCQGAIYWSGVAAVVFGTSISFLRAHGWRQIDIPAEEVVRRGDGARTVVLGGVLEADCNALFLRATRSTRQA